MGPGTDVPLLERGSPETNRGPAVANPRIRVCATVVSAASPCHTRSSGGHLASERIGDEHPCPQLLNRDMRVAGCRHLIPLLAVTAGRPTLSARHPVHEARDECAAGSSASRSCWACPAVRGPPTSPPPCTGSARAAQERRSAR